MKKNVADTSIEIYKRLTAEGKVSHMQARILSKMEEGKDYTRNELVCMTLLPINAVTGRVNELVHELSLLEEGEKRKCSVTGNKVGTVRLAAVEMAEAA